MPRFWLILSAAVVLVGLGTSWASYDDGTHSISVEGDWGVLGQIKETSEDGTGAVDDYMFRRTTDLPMSREIDALSSGQHPQTTLSDMFSGNVTLMYSIDGSDVTADDTDSNIYWVQTTGSVDVNNRLIHDTAADLGLADDPAQDLYYDLDSIESGAHTGAWPNFPSHGDNPEYYSVGPGGTMNASNIFVGQNWDAGTQRYLSYSIAMTYASLGLVDGTDLEDLIVFDELATHPVYGTGSRWAFFTVHPGDNGDTVGDNVYVSSGDGTNHLWYDPQDNRNWDSLDVVPEPGTMALMGFGLAGLALVRRRRKS
jgi:hypothetical protein